MTAKVNLLPQATRERDREVMGRWAVFGILLVVILALGGVYWWNLTEVRDAEERLATAERETAELRAREAELANFADLADRIENASELIAGAMWAEISFAGFLQDVALVMPPDAQLDTLTVSLEPQEEGAVEVANFSATGQTLTYHAPGVERLLLEFEKAATIQDVFLSTSLLEDAEEQPDLEGVTSFTFDGRLNATARTGRYVGGLPEELR